MANSLHTFITDSSGFFYQYIYARTKFLQWSSLIIYPVLLAAIYTPIAQKEMVYACIILFAALFGYGLFKTSPKTLQANGHFSYHIILYLCAVEILPLILLYTLLI
jgi:hypothetical protein